MLFMHAIMSLPIMQQLRQLLAAARLESGAASAFLRASASAAALLAAPPPASHAELCERVAELYIVARLVEAVPPPPADVAPQIPQQTPPSPPLPLAAPLLLPLYARAAAAGGPEACWLSTLLVLVDGGGSSGDGDEAADWSSRTPSEVLEALAGAAGEAALRSGAVIAAAWRLRIPDADKSAVSTTSIWTGPLAAWPHLPPLPPLFSSVSGEVSAVWAHAEPVPLLRVSVGPTEVAARARVRELVGRATTAALPSDDAAELAALLLSAAGGSPCRIVAARAYLAPAVLSRLVDASPGVAALALRCLALVAPPSAIARCWAALILGDVTLHSLEVVSVLAGGGNGSGGGGSGASQSASAPTSPTAARAASTPLSLSTARAGDAGDEEMPAPQPALPPLVLRRAPLSAAAAAATAAPAVLPADCLAFFVSRCVSACDAAAESAFAQNRLARLVAVFLTALIRNRAIVAGDLLLAEVAAFATRFSRVRESAALFKAVKSLEAAADWGSGGTGGGA